MASKTSIYPNFYNCKLAINLNNLTIGTDIGYFTPYPTDDMVWLTDNNPQQGSYNIGFYRDANLCNVYGYNENDAPFTYSWTTGCVRPAELQVPYKPVIDSFLTTYQYFKCYIDTFDSTKNFYVYFRWKKNGDADTQIRMLQVSFGIGTVDSVEGGSYRYLLYKAMSDAEAISMCSTIIRTFKLYIGGYSYSSRNSLSITTLSTGLMSLIKFSNGYTWTPLVNLGNVVTIDADTEKYEPEPAPPEPPEPSDDPYNPGGYSGGGGGPNPDGTGATGTGGLHDDTSDTISTPSLPSSVATGSGLFTAYNPSASQLANFANELWNADISSIGDLFRLLFGGDAFNAIIGLHLLPVQPDTSGTPNIMLGNWDSGAPAPKIVNQYKQVPFGSLMLPEYWGNSIDYSPYTRIQLALPYIGIVDVDTDDVLGSNNTLTYNIDVLSGAICATLHCAKGNLNSVIYQWSGSCAVSLPITGASFNAVLGAVAGIGAAAAGTFALASGPVGAAIGAAGSTLAGTGMLAGAAANTFGSMKGKVQKSGAFGGNSGALGIMTPYFIVTRPVQSVPSSWQADKGYPSNISAQLGTISGYTEVSEINLECSGTEAEKKEIIDLLKKGVIF